MMKRLVLVALLSGVIAFLIVVFGFFLFRDAPSVFSSIIIVALILFVVPVALLRYFENWKVRALEDYFPQFMRDLVEAIRSGMTLPQAVRSVSENDYGYLSPYVRKLSAQLDWGIPFDKAFLNFSKGTKSKLIKRIASTIIESHRFGGNITDVFEAISSASVEVERLREERKLYINSQLITSYVIFFVFLMVIIGLERFLVPALSEVSIGEIAPTPKEMEVEYSSIFRNLIIMQGFFAGLIIGKMAEGAVASGIKHSLFLVIVGMLVYTLAGFF